MKCIHKNLANRNLLLIFIVAISLGVSTLSYGAKRAQSRSCSSTVRLLIHSIADISRIVVGTSRCYGTNNKTCQCSSSSYSNASPGDKEIIHSIVRSIKRQLRIAKRNCFDPNTASQVGTRDTPVADSRDWCVKKWGNDSTFYLACNKCKGTSCCMGVVSSGAGKGRFQCYQQTDRFERPVLGKATDNNLSGEQQEDTKEEIKDEIDNVREELEVERPQKPTRGN